jgi:hypothetical protein|eukprot:g8391.t1
MSGKIVSSAAAIAGSTVGLFSFYLYHTKRSPYINPKDYGISSEGLEKETLTPNTRPSAFRPLLSCLSFAFGAGVDTIFALAAGYGRGKLHFSTEKFGPLKEALEVATIMKNDSLTCDSYQSADEMTQRIGHPDIEWEGEWRKIQPSGCWERDGKFLSPVCRLFRPSLVNAILNEESKYCYVRYVLPGTCDPTRPVKEREQKGATVPLVMHLPCSGDQYYDWRSKHFAYPLAEDEGIGSIIIVSPFYGPRKIPNRPIRGVQVNRVADLLTYGICILTEGVSIFSYLRDTCPEHRDGRFTVCGISMGAEIAGLMAAYSPIPFNVVAVAPAHCATSIWREGVLEKVCAWDKIEEEFGSSKYGGEEKRLVVNNVGAEVGEEEVFTRGYDYVFHVLDKTDLRQFNKPFNWLPPSERPKGIVIGAIHDAYIPLESVREVANMWKGWCSLRYILGGHCTLVVTHKELIRQSIAEVSKR